MGGKLLALIFSALGMSILSSLIGGATKTYATEPQSCSDANHIDVVYIRGSGEGYGGDFYKALTPALDANLNQDNYKLFELTPSLVTKSLSEYKAIPITGSTKAAYSGVRAIVSHGNLGEYQKSVYSGTLLLKQYLTELNLKPSECAVLLGYSQGAHVIGDTLTELASEYPGILNRIIYVGLFGDPKLDLRGEGFSLGKNIPWYRGDALPVINGGSLGSRIPYVPKFKEEYMAPVGSWCYEDDFICTENYMTTPTINAHGKYPERAFSQMSLEVANAINQSYGLPPGQVFGLTCSSAKQDIVILLDTSPLMRRDAKLFTDTPMYDPFYTTPQGAKLPARTAGQMLTSVGCGNTRIAVVGYSRPVDGPPRLLLDFTSDSSAYDSLMKSLYEPSSNGTYDRTQFREGISEALKVNWREDANRVIYALTDIAGSGPDWGGGGSGYWDSLKQDRYRKDTITQQALDEARNKRVVVWGLPIKHSYAGYLPTTPTSGGDLRSYLNMFAEQTGAYNWNKEWINYGEYNFKFTRLHDTVNEALQRQEKIIATATPVRGKSGASVTVKLMDTVSVFAGAKLRNESVSYRWYVDCHDKTIYTSTSVAELTFTPTSSQKCTGMVVASVKNMTGNGCYSGCPEPFPPYMVRSFPFEIDIKLTDYVPKIPVAITDMHKTIYDDRVEYTWDEPPLNGSDSAVYIVKELDGNVLAATTSRQLTIEQTGGGDPVIRIVVAGTDGMSAPTSSADVLAIDMRTVEIPEIIDLPYFESDNPFEPLPPPPATDPDITVSDTAPQDSKEEGAYRGTNLGPTQTVSTDITSSPVLQPASILPSVLGDAASRAASIGLPTDDRHTLEEGAITFGANHAEQPENITIATQGRDILSIVVIATLLGSVLKLRKSLQKT